MFSRAYQRLLTILFSLMFLGGNALCWVHLEDIVDWWWLALYSVFCVIVWIKLVKKMWPKKPRP